jgi:hypothetical protein
LQTTTAAEQDPAAQLEQAQGPRGPGVQGPTRLVGEDRSRRVTRHPGDRAERRLDVCAGEVSGCQRGEEPDRGLQQGGALRGVVAGGRPTAHDRGLHPDARGRICHACGLLGAVDGPRLVRRVGEALEPSAQRAAEAGQGQRTGELPTQVERFRFQHGGKTACLVD